MCAELIERDEGREGREGGRERRRDGGKEGGKEGKVVVGVKEM